MYFTTETMQEILPMLQAILKERDEVSFEVLNPDVAQGYAGTPIHIGKTTYLYRGYKAWTDLAELLYARMLTPKETTYPLVKLSFKKLSKTHSFHHDTKECEKYGSTSHFWQIYKMEEPAFLYYYTQALDNVTVAQRTNILNLGVNRADEFDVIRKHLDTKTYQNLSLTGIDHSRSAIAYAKEYFKGENVHFYVEDINKIDSLGLGKFDLLISIGTLQSPSIPFKPFFMHLVQHYLKEESAIILGFPNARWVDGELIYGAKAPNYAMNEMSLLLNDIIFCKKYLQQKRYRVTITGKQYLFLTATKILTKTKKSPTINQ